MGLKIKDSDVKKILAEVETEIGALLKSEKDRLAKAAEGSPSERPEESAPPASPAGPEETAPVAPPVDSAAPAGPPASPEGAPVDGAPPADGAPADPAADAGPVDPQQLMAEYAKLPPEELKVHYMACKAAIAQVMGADPDAASAGAPPDASASASASPAGPAAASPAPLAQAEVPANGGKIVPAAKSEPAADGAPLAKAEDRVKELEAIVADQNSTVERLAKAVDKFLGQPVRKAITGTDFGPRAGSQAQEPSKAEVDAKLKEVISAGKLSKSDSERVIAYSMGHVGYDQIKDLIEKK